MSNLKSITCIMKSTCNLRIFIQFLHVTEINMAMSILLYIQILLLHVIAKIPEGNKFTRLSDIYNSCEVENLSSCL
jgi:hypothetical protein